MRLLLPISLAVLALAGGLGVVLATGDDSDAADDPLAIPGQPQIEILTPRNGSRHQNNSAIVRVGIENFRLAPEHFGEQPRLGEGHLKFSLNRVPDCVDPEIVAEAEADPRGSGRLTGPSFDYPEFSGANGLLAERTGSAGQHSPATEPHILYSNLHRGFYRLVVTLARNNGINTPAHDVTTFEILPNSDDKPDAPACEPGQVAAADAAEDVR